MLVGGSPIIGCFHKEGKGKGVAFQGGATPIKYPPQYQIHCNSMWAHLQDDQLLDGGTLVLLVANPELPYLGLSCSRFLTTASTF